MQYLVPKHYSEHIHTHACMRMHTHTHMSMCTHTCTLRHPHTRAFWLCKSKKCTQLKTGSKRRLDCDTWQYSDGALYCFPRGWPTEGGQGQQWRLLFGQPWEPRPRERACHLQGNPAGCCAIIRASWCPTAQDRDLAGVKVNASQHNVPSGKVESPEAVDCFANVCLNLICGWKLWSV